FWAAVLMLAPTDWARMRVVRAIEGATGSPARLDALRFGPLGGVWLLGLEIGDPVALAGPAPGASCGPWLDATAVRIDLSPARLLAGHLEPTRVEAKGLHLRVHRRFDGSFEFANLIRTPAEEDPEAADPAAPARAEPGPISFRLE